VRQQLTQRDDWCTASGEFRREARKPAGNGIVECDAALFDQLHRCRGDDRLGHGGEIEDRVLAHGPGGLSIGEARGAVINHGAITGDQHHGSDDASLGDCRADDRIEALFE